MFRGTRWNIEDDVVGIRQGTASRWMPRASALADDIYQLGGDVLVDPSGIVRLLHNGPGRFVFVIATITSAYCRMY